MKCLAEAPPDGNPAGLDAVDDEIDPAVVGRAVPTI